MQGHFLGILSILAASWCSISAAGAQNSPGFDSVPASTPIQQSRYTRQTGGLETAQLLSSTAGWARSEKQLMFTNDGGSSWKDITPQTDDSKYTIAQVVFNTAQQGWVVQEKAADSGPGWSLLVSSTSNQGGAWVSHLVSGVSNDDWRLFGGSVAISFANSTHGWLELKAAGSSNFSFGSLYETKDGGLTWNALPKPPIFGSMSFENDRNGYLDWKEGNQLYRTTDGGKSWAAVSLPPVANAQQVTPTLSALNVAGDAIAVVRTAETTDDKSIVELLQSTNAGASWSMQGSSAALPGHKGKVVPLASGALKYAFQEGSGKLAIGGVKDSHSADLPSSWKGSVLAVAGVSFADAKNGWVVVGKSQCGSSGCSNTMNLLRTTDGGDNVVESQIPFAVATASALPQGSVRASTPSSFTAGASSSSSASSDAAAGYELIEFGTQGIDTLSCPVVGNMTSWSDGSYSHDAAVGIYIGGKNATDKVQANLTANWVSTVSCYGWGLLPLWVGPQAPGSVCSTCAPLSDLSYNGSYSIGLGEANAAVSRMQALGMTSGIVYYDLETYNTTSTAAPNGLVQGWVTGLHSAGYDAGVYGSPYNAADWLVQSPPDDVWLIATNHSSTSVNGQVPLADSNWANDQRLSQWQDNVPEDVNGYTLTVDYDLLAGAVSSLPNYHTCICDNECSSMCQNYNPSAPECQPTDPPGPCDSCDPGEYSFYCCDQCGIGCIG